MRRGFAFAFELLRLLLPFLFFGLFFPPLFFSFTSLFLSISPSPLLFISSLSSLCARIFLKITYMAN